MPRRSSYPHRTKDPHATRGGKLNVQSSGGWAPDSPYVWPILTPVDVALTDCADLTVDIATVMASEVRLAAPFYGAT
eukprot:scaffold672377_cov59-Prasinocladus_malaysianus.AAC.1